MSAVRSGAGRMSAAGGTARGAAASAARPAAARRARRTRSRRRADSRRRPRWLGAGASAVGDPAAPPDRLVAVVLYPFVASPFFTYQIGAQSLALGLIALSLTFLGGYGGMVSLAQMTVAGFAGYLRGDLRQQQLRGDQPGLAVVAGGVASRSCSATVFAAAVGWLSVRTEGIYTIMITLAIGVAFFYLAQQNYTVFNGFQGFSKIAAPSVFGIDLQRAGALLLRRAGLRARPATSSSSTWCARRSASRCRASATTRAGCSRWATTSPRTASPPTPWPGCSRRSAAC